LILLQPTSPLRTRGDIDRSLELLTGNNDARSVVSVCEAAEHPMYCNTLPKDGNMKDFLPRSVRGKNRQELPLYYRLNGAVYAAYCDYLRKNHSFFGNKTYAYIMPRERSVDIDTKMDFLLAEFLIKRARRSTR
jgi:CMP-N,N'-diacetyllegionaminic acid synthase